MHSVPARAVRRQPHCHDVLVIEDYRETRDAILDLLRTKGFRAWGAESGPDALDLLQSGLRPCVIILDIRLPGMSGWEVCERLQVVPELAAIPVVVLSVEVPREERPERAGIREYLRKPIDGSTLVEAIERYCEIDPPSHR